MSSAFLLLAARMAARSGPGSLIRLLLPLGLVSECVMQRGGRGVSMIEAVFPDVKFDGRRHEV